MIQLATLLTCNIRTVAGPSLVVDFFAFKLICYVHSCLPTVLFIFSASTSIVSFPCHFLLPVLIMYRGTSVLVTNRTQWTADECSEILHVYLTRRWFLVPIILVVRSRPVLCGTARWVYNLIFSFSIHSSITL